MHNGGFYYAIFIDVYRVLIMYYLIRIKYFSWVDFQYIESKKNWIW